MAIKPEETYIIQQHVVGKLFGEVGLQYLEKHFLTLEKDALTPNPSYLDQLEHEIDNRFLSTGRHMGESHPHWNQGKGVIFIVFNDICRFPKPNQREECLLVHRYINAGWNSLTILDYSLVDRSDYWGPSNEDSWWIIFKHHRRLYRTQDVRTDIEWMDTVEPMISLRPS